MFKKIVLALVIFLSVHKSKAQVKYTSEEMKAIDAAAAEAEKKVNASGVKDPEVNGKTLNECLIEIANASSGQPLVGSANKPLSVKYNNKNYIWDGTRILSGGAAGSVLWTKNFDIPQSKSNTEALVKIKSLVVQEQFQNLQATNFDKTSNFEAVKKFYDAYVACKDLGLNIKNNKNISAVSKSKIIEMQKMFPALVKTKSAGRAAKGKNTL